MTHRLAQHTVREKQKLLNRVKRLRGQVAAVEELLEGDVDCERALLEDHIRFHVMHPDEDPNSHASQAAEQLVDIVKSYLK
jgi:FrmR/RcnR family transcriptional regulator, repressor of frmRAB operon